MNFKIQIRGRHAILCQFLHPSPVTFWHTSQNSLRKYVSHLAPPRFLVGLVQKPRTKPPVQILTQLFTGFFVLRFCQEVFCLEDFVRGGFCLFPLLSEYICHNRKLSITLNFVFHMYDKNFL